MVDRSERRTHHIYLTEIIQFQAFSKALDKAQIARLHTKDALSSAQIARRLGCSKTFVITTLKRLKLLRPMKESQSNPKNYRRAIAPYGFRIVDGKLAPSRPEMKVCRLIVDLMDRRGLTSVQAAQFLEGRGLKGRNGRPSWHNTTVSRIYARWKGKL
jgi:hypothetical protein